MTGGYTLKGLILVDLDSKGCQDVSSWRTETPVLDEDTCVNCGLCISFCPEGAIMRKDERPFIDLRFCKGCGICSHECPSKAIEMVIGNI